MALLKELPEKIRQSVEAYVGCIAGAILVDEYKNLLEASGLRNVKVTISGASSCFAPDTRDPIAKGVLDQVGDDKTLQDCAVSIYVEGDK